LFKCHLARSRGGDRLFFRLEYHRSTDQGPNDVERVGCYDAAQAKTILLEGFPRLDRAPEEPRVAGSETQPGGSCAAAVRAGPPNSASPGRERWTSAWGMRRRGRFAG